MASGDITTSLVARVRTNLDESATGFWSNDEIYRALTDAQREVINFVLTIYKARVEVNPDEKLPEVLRTLLATTTGTGTQNLPSGYLYPLDIYTSTAKILIRPERNKGFGKNNTYLTSSSAQPFCSISATQLVLETSVAWTLDYLAMPSADLSASVDPTIGSIAYNALVEFATFVLLNKDENQRSQQHLNRFLQAVQSLAF